MDEQSSSNNEVNGVDTKVINLHRLQHSQYWTKTQDQRLTTWLQEPITDPMLGPSTMLLESVWTRLITSEFALILTIHLKTEAVQANTMSKLVQD